MVNRLLLGIARDRTGIVRGYWYGEGTDNIYWSDIELKSYKYNGEYDARLYKYMTFYSEMNKNIDLVNLKFEYICDTGMSLGENLRVYFEVLKNPVDFYCNGEKVDSTVYDSNCYTYLLIVFKHRFWTNFDCGMFVTADSSINGTVGIPIPANVFWYIVRKGALRDYSRLLGVVPSWYSRLFTDDEIILEDTKVKIFNRVAGWLL